MITAFSPIGREDYQYWVSHDRKILKRINLLIQDIHRNPHDKNGLGRPEGLKANLSGYYSRRITDEHRLVYTFKGEYLVIAQCRFHYGR